MCDVKPSLQSAKTALKDLHTALDDAKVGEESTALSCHVTKDYLWRGFHPFHELRGTKEVGERFWTPLKTSMKHMKRRLDLFFAGQNHLDGGKTVWVVAMGHLMGLLDESWLGIPPTGKIVMLRFAEFNRVTEDGKVSETAMFFDIPHLMIQAGLKPFPTEGTGAQLVQPGPLGHGGLLFDEQDPKVGTKTMEVINSMLKDNWSADWQKLDSLENELARTWTKDMTWWGPAGIGSSYTIERYAQQHSRIFRQAFNQKHKVNGHIARVAEGHFGGFFGWPNLTLRFSGGPFMGFQPTEKEGDMRVIDIYRREGEKLAENWVFIDLLHFWNMQGIDILGRLNKT